MNGSEICKSWCYAYMEFCVFTSRLLPITERQPCVRCTSYHPWSGSVQVKPVFVLNVYPGMRFECIYHLRIHISMVYLCIRLCFCYGSARLVLRFLFWQYWWLESQIRVCEKSLILPPGASCLKCRSRKTAAPLFPWLQCLHTACIWLLWHHWLSERFVCVSHAG